jgi:hypothetical protein
MSASPEIPSLVSEAAALRPEFMLAIYLGVMGQKLYYQQKAILTNAFASMGYVLLDTTHAAFEVNRREGRRDELHYRMIVYVPLYHVFDIDGARQCGQTLQQRFVSVLGHIHVVIRAGRPLPNVPILPPVAATPDMEWDAFLAARNEIIFERERENRAVLQESPRRALDPLTFQETFMNAKLLFYYNPNARQNLLHSYRPRLTVMTPRSIMKMPSYGSEQLVHQALEGLWHPHATLIPRIDLPNADELSIPANMLACPEAGGFIVWRPRESLKRKIVTVLHEEGPPVKYNSADGSCPICMEEIVAKTHVNCGHLFCTPCINKHLQSKSVCPICNATVTELYV